MGKHVMTIAVAAVIAAILLLYLVCFQVREAEIAIVTTFGKAEAGDVKVEPGLYWKWPWPVQKVYRLDGRLHVFEGTFEELLTKDKRNLSVTACAGWRIATGSRKAPLRFLESLGTVETAEAALAALVRNQKSSVIAQYNLADLIHAHGENEAKERLDKFKEAEGLLIKEVRKVAAEEYGIEVQFARIKRLTLPSSVTTKVFERMRKEREREVKKLRGQGEGKANAIRNRAKNKRAQILAKARADARRIRAEGEKKAAEFLRFLAAKPELALFLRQVDALQNLKERTTYILDSTTPPYNLLTQGYKDKGDGPPALTKDLLARRLAIKSELALVEKLIKTKAEPQRAKAGSKTNPKPESK